MYLLYCDQAGIVIAYHDDASVFTPIEAYQNVVRIVPYDMPISTLQKFGPAPVGGSKPSERVDTRPYAQPDPTPDILKLYAGQCRFVKECAGFEFTAASGKIPIWTDRISYNYISGLVEFSKTLQANTVINYTQGGLAYKLKASECTGLFNAYTELMQRARTAEATALDDLNSATPTLTTYEQIDEMFVGVVTAGTAKRPLMRMPK